MTGDAGRPEEIVIRADEDVVRVRQLVRAHALRIKLSLVDQTKLVTATSELARNTLIYGGGGTARVEEVANGHRKGVRATFHDDGPGIPDVTVALADGWSSGTGLGLGLGGAKRLVDQFDLDTEVGRGTDDHRRQVGPMTAAGCLPVTEDVAWVRIEDGTAHGQARRAAAGLAARLGFGEVRAAEIGLAVTELETNLAKHATEGVLVVRAVRAVTEAAVEVVAIDRGPGMADVDLSRRDGESTTGTLGVGLGAVARLADATSVLSELGRGTVVTARFHPRRAPLAELPGERASGITRPISGEEVCGDAYAVHAGRPAGCG